MLLLLIEGGNAIGSGATSAKIPVQPVPPTGIAANRFFNGVGPHAPDLRELGDYLNALLARRPRILYSHYVWRPYTTADATDRETQRFACHTGPLANKVRITCVRFPAQARAASDSYAYWELETELTGTGTTTTGASIFGSGLYANDAAAEANFFSSSTQEFDVEPDTDYRFTLHQINAFDIVSVVAYEVPRAVLDSSVDSPIVNVTRISQGAGIYGGATPSGAVHELHEVADKLWRRGGHPLMYWSRDGATALATTAGSAANIIDETTTPAATTYGWPVQLTYSGSLDSSDVGIVFWVNAYVSNALGTGTITLRDQANNVIATCSVTGTSAAWYSDTGTLTDGSGGTPTTRIEVYAEVSGGYTLSVHAFGAFMYTA
jgi:hypothetical protein